MKCKSGENSCEIAVCVLNYLNYKETTRCVDSVLGQKDCEYQIIVVDNGSDNGSYYYLRKKYCNEEKVTILHVNRNYGFAKGHNIGIHYAKKNFGADYILLLNSDIILPEEDYLRKMVDADEEGIGVLGSKIVMRDGREYKFPAQYVTFPATLFRYLQLAAYCNNLYKTADCLGRAAAKKYHSEEILHGSAFMLTPAYFQCYTGLYDKTFLYEEETLLYFLCQRCGLKEKKIEDTYVIHKGGQSTKLFNGGQESEKERRILKSYKYVLFESICFTLQQSRIKQSTKC